MREIIKKRRELEKGGRKITRWLLCIKMIGNWWPIIKNWLKNFVKKILKHVQYWASETRLTTPKSVLCSILYPQFIAWYNQAFWWFFAMGKTEMMDTEVQTHTLSYNWKKSLIILCVYLLGGAGSERWRWMFCHFPSFLCQTLVSSAFLVCGIPSLKKREKTKHY